MPIQTIVDTLSLKITPNPSTGIFTLQKATDETAQITMYNLLGNVIFKSITQSQTTALDLTNYAKGIYFVTVTEGNKLYCQKVVSKFLY